MFVDEVESLYMYLSVSLFLCDNGLLSAPRGCKSL